MLYTGLSFFSTKKSNKDSQLKDEFELNKGYKVFWIKKTYSKRKASTERRGFEVA
jgi:hypothetical protein